MRAIMLMFDTLNRHFLPCYGCEWTHAPNFQRLAEKTCVFDNCYIGSMPCMPARRELHTGRYNFLHRSWGPLEPYDDSAIAMLSASGIYTHLVTDHQHYWEDGGATYHFRYTSFDFIRGQEGDPCYGDVEAMRGVDKINYPASVFKQAMDQVNRAQIKDERDMPQAKTFASGLEFIQKNKDADNWFLQLECFDPHEPFCVPEAYKKWYDDAYEGEPFDWPGYGRAEADPGKRSHIRKTYAALLSMCDHYLGKLLDLMDACDLWKDTMLIVNTDHGFMLEEHDYWGKNIMPWYNETAHIPLFIWDPRSRVANERRKSLVQTIDLPVTLLEFFGLEKTRDMQGHSLQEVIRTDTPVREDALFGVFGGHVCVTDGRYVYMRGIGEGKNEPLYQYTYMPMHLYNLFSVPEMRTVELAEPFSFTKGCRLMKIRSGRWVKSDTHARIGYVDADHIHESLLFDLESDPQQLHPLEDEALEKRMLEKLAVLMTENDAPAEQYERLNMTRKMGG
ncbi:MAG: sulfatase [Marvinbryantia sp.]|uniref:sulfatase n=1 Tax=Marvinbryantia sp. TaxID=2496532 RepID=UPI00399BB947